MLPGRFHHWLHAAQVTRLQAALHSFPVRYSIVQVLSFSLSNILVAEFPRNPPRVFEFSPENGDSSFSFRSFAALRMTGLVCILGSGLLLNPSSFMSSNQYLS